jgi:hypothetical protein
MLTIQGQSNPYCENIALYGACSANSSCGCADVLFIGQICTQKPACSCLTRCELNSYCSQPDTTCVVDVRCGGSYLCYPNHLFSVDSCPAPSPLTTR